MITTDQTTLIQLNEKELVAAAGTVAREAAFSRAHCSGSIVPAGGDPYAETVRDASAVAYKCADTILAAGIEMFRNGATVREIDDLLSNCYFKREALSRPNYMGEEILTFEKFSLVLNGREWAVVEFDRDSAE